MTLVGVEHLGRRVTGDPAVDPQRPDAADAEQQLLAEPVLAVAAVEPVGDVDVVLGVALDVGVQHQQRHPADLATQMRAISGGPSGRSIEIVARVPSGSRSSEIGSSSGSSTG